MKWVKDSRGQQLVEDNSANTSKGSHQKGISRRSDVKLVVEEHSTVVCEKVAVRTCQSHFKDKARNPCGRPALGK